MQTDLAHTCTGMGATNSATGQGHSDHSNSECIGMGATNSATGQSHSDHSNSECQPLVHRGNSAMSTQSTQKSLVSVRTRMAS